MIYVISDTHGNYDGLIKALRKHKIIDKHGNRQLARKHKLISIGDLANCVGESVEGDRKCLSLIPEVIDYMIIGNHEMGYIDPATKFHGFVWDNVIVHQILGLLNDGKIIPAYMHGALISHAGLSKQMLPVDMSMQDAYSTIWREWEDKNYSHSWFSSIGRCRGGRDNCGGIIWCDFHDEFRPTSFPQIVGHSSKGGNVKMIGNTVCIDVGAKDLDTKPFILEVR
jgi:hypothetical protein